MFKQKRKNVIKIDIVKKDRKNLINKVEIGGSRDELFIAVSNTVTGAIISKRLSVNDAVLAFKTGIEQAEKIRGGQRND